VRELSPCRRGREPGTAPGRPWESCQPPIHTTKDNPCREQFGECTGVTPRAVNTPGTSTNALSARDACAKALVHRIGTRRSAISCIGSEKLSDVVTYGVRRRRKFHEAAAKYLGDFAKKSTIRRDAAALNDMAPYIGDLWLDQINNDSFNAYRNARQDLEQWSPRVHSNCSGVMGTFDQRRALYGHN
jgi:hypothetical protein